MSFRSFPTFSVNNQFVITCPIFGADTKIAVCLQLREMVWVGKRPTKRRGCQACMSAGKCPMVKMMRRVVLTGKDPGLYSSEPRKGRLESVVLDQIGPIVVLESTIDRFEVDGVERRKIVEANDQARHHAPASVKSSEKRVRKSNVMAPSGAAATGDMSAAVNEAMKDVDA